MGRICIIDDKEILRDSLRGVLAGERHDVEEFDDPVEALPAIERGGFDLVLTDLKMPRMDGVSLIRHLRERGKDVPVLLMTAYATVETAVEAMRLGAFDYIQKPFDMGKLTALVEAALKHAASRGTGATSAGGGMSAGGGASNGRVLIGESAAAQCLRREIAQVAASHAAVLVSGESGVGKELVAEQIRRLSPRANGPMLCLNCAALSAPLLESELFGHERGAFTGAERLRKGRFEIADGGTLLLDEVSEMELGLQAKLLRVLQEGQFERVGSSETRIVDVRILATTNRDLREWVDQGRFREDLYFRLNVLPIAVPPLRERSEDIPLLAEYFLKKAAQREGSAPLRLTPTACRRLQAHDWPGNIRELENLCLRAATLCPGPEMREDELAKWLGEREERRPRAQADGRAGHLMEDMERRLIEQTLTEQGGHRARTAQALGIGLRTLTLKLKKWREEGMIPASRLSGRATVLSG